MRRILVCSAALLLFATGCSRKPPLSEVLNVDAAVPSDAPVQPLNWRIITTSVDAVHETTSTLFGNDIAIQSVRSSQHTEYPVGAVLALVTWTQKEDSHWFGAKIPKQFQLMEIVKVTQGADGKSSPSYQRFGVLGDGAMGGNETREAYILGERAAVMP